MYCTYSCGVGCISLSPDLFFRVLKHNLCSVILYMLPQEPCCIQLADLQWHAGPVQAGWRTAAPSEEDHLPPGLQSDDL